jgi:transcriptional regulator with XRE-family HTH domain
VPREDIYAVLAARIRGEREAAGLTIEQLAERAGIGASFLGLIETRERKPSLATVAAVADALGIPVAALFRDVPVRRGGEAYKFAQQLASLVRDKTRAQRAVIMSTVRALARSLGPKP